MTSPKLIMLLIIRNVSINFANLTSIIVTDTSHLKLFLINLFFTLVDSNGALLFSDSMCYMNMQSDVFSATKTHHTNGKLTCTCIWLTGHRAQGH